MTGPTGGRPRANLTVARSRELARLARRLADREQAVERARGELAHVVAAARTDGASLRAIGEPLGLSNETVHRLSVAGGYEPVPAVPRPPRAPATP